MKAQIGLLRETFEGQIRELKALHTNSEEERKKSEEERKKSEEKQNKLRTELQWDVLLSAATMGHYCRVSMLLDRTDLSADFVHPHYGEQTILFAASSNGHAAVISVLLERGADVDLCGTDGMTPLFAAVLEGHSKVVEKLLAHGANTNLKPRHLGPWRDTSACCVARRTCRHCGDAARQGC